MDFERLRRNHLKRNIVIGVVGVLLISAVVLNFTRAKYRVTESIPLVNGTINYAPYDFKMIAMYQENNNGEYVEIEKMPSSGYTINEEKSYCEINGEKDSNAKLATIGGNHTFANLQRGAKCYLYFDEKPITNIQELIASYTTVLTRTDFSEAIPATTTGTIYKSANSSQYDNDGEVYYFAGNPTDNWVQFGGYYWRIIRINGDGSVRLIYQGTSPNTTGTETQITVDGDNTFVFNSSAANNMYVGFMYQSGQVHGLQSSSIIKEILDSWYSSSGLNKYEDYLDGNAGFCNDRTPYSGSGTGTSETRYAAYNRLYTNKSPTFKCSNSSDLFTTSGSSDGNKKLTNPIGLITADEIAYI